MSGFKRGIESGKFIEQLAEEAKKGSWWADVLNDPKLFIAVRDEYLNVYWRGHSLFRVDMGPSGLHVTTHPKFLLDPALSEQVPLVNGKFEVKEGGFLLDYGTTTLDKMKKAAGIFAEEEGAGCHEIILKNPQIIDCEIAFPKDSSGDKGALRVDLLSLQQGGELVFWEAKNFTNGDLRALGDVIPVCEQVARYREYVSRPQHGAAIEKSYKQVVKNLVQINNMREKPLDLPEQVMEVAEEKRKVTLGDKPKVGLVIFGFGEAERRDPNWRRHRERLEKDCEIARVIAAGDAKNIRLEL